MEEGVVKLIVKKALKCYLILDDFERRSINKENGGGESFIPKF
jgi:hypothetical protein